MRSWREEKYAGTSEFPFSAAGGGNTANLALAETKGKEYAGCLTKRGNYNVVVAFALLFGPLRWLVGRSGEGRGGVGMWRGVEVD